MYWPSSMNIYFMQNWDKQKWLSGIPSHDLVLNKMFNVVNLWSTCHVYQMKKKEKMQEIWLGDRWWPKIAEFKVVSLGHCLWGSGVYLLFTVRNPPKTHSLLVFTMIDTEIQHSLVWNFQRQKKFWVFYSRYVSCLLDCCHLQTQFNGS
jgi:hypothetical protein